MPTVAFHTLGCKLNFSETSALARQFRDAGWKKVAMQEPADVYLVNTCSVTENADRECRTIVNRALHANPEGKIIVVGCYAQLKPATIAAIPGVNLVLGASEKFNVLQYLDHISREAEALVMGCDIATVNDFIPAASGGDRTRVFLKVQDGCDYSCTFCTIPLARGKSRSDALSNVLQRAEKAVQEGAREIVLTGVNLGDFGLTDSSGRYTHRFYDLASALETSPSFEGVRFRISSIEPNLLTDELIKLVAASERFMPHFHIPLQSGSDVILKKMRRRYLSQLYRDKTELIHALMPHAAIGADVITGFPGESEACFNETIEFLQSLPLSYLHAFTYSERDNTPAASMSEVVPVHTRKMRNSILRNLSQKLNRAFSEKIINTIQPVLFEAHEQDGLMYGYTPSYIRVSIPYEAAFANNIIPVRIDSISAEGIVAAVPCTEKSLV